MRRKVLLAGAIFLGIVAYNCGGGGGDTTSTLSALDLYITDAQEDINLLSSLEVTLYSIDLCRDTACNDTVNVFSSNTGVTIDLTNLEGVLHYIATAQVPQEQFQAMKIEVAQSGTVVYKGIAGSFSLQLQDGENESVSCDDTARRCSVVVAGAINPAINNKLLVDFDLKNFQMSCNVDQTNDTVSCTITSMPVVARPETPQNITNRFKFEMYAIIDPQQINVQNQNQNQFSFQWENKTYTAQIGDNTICEIKDMNYIGPECISQLQQFNTPLCLELKLVGDPAQADIIQNVVKFEVKSPKKCGYEMEVEDEYGMHKREMKVVFKGINENYIIAEGDIKFKITDTTYCEIDTEGEEDRYYIGVECLNELPKMSATPYVEVEYVMQNGEYIALKVDIDYEGED